MQPTEPTSDSLEREVADRTWYHTIELPGGVTTRGQFDTRSAVRRIPFPHSLVGKRCLDVGTSDGFWAFEMERRGAAEVVALDIDDPSLYDWPEPRPTEFSRMANQEPGVNRNFELAHRTLSSAVKRVDCPVYRVSPERLGMFDFVFMGTLLLHLRDPVRALKALRSVVAGEFLSADVISLSLTIAAPMVPMGHLDANGRPRWWTPNLAAYRRILVAAGFEIVRSGRPYFTPFGAGLAKADWKHADVTPGYVLFQLVIRHLGTPFAWAVCRNGTAGGRGRSP